jgi:hypothetical protein
VNTQYREFTERCQKEEIWEAIFEEGVVPGKFFEGISWGICGKSSMDLFGYYVIFFGGVCPGKFFGGRGWERKGGKE